MSREFVNELCKALPGAEVSDPWGTDEKGCGHDAWKVGGKMFALIGTKGLGVSVKCADVATADMLKDVGVAIKAPYFHKSWVHLTWDAAELDEIKHRIEASYDVIRGGLTKKVQAGLASRT